MLALAEELQNISLVCRKAGISRSHFYEIKESSKVEETMNAMLDAETDRLCRAERYERTEARRDTRAGSNELHLQTKPGEVRLKVPKLRTLPFERRPSLSATGDGKVRWKKRWWRCILLA